MPFSDSAVAEAAKEDKCDKDDKPDVVVGESVSKAVTHNRCLPFLLSPFPGL